MADETAENEGFQPLDDFVCEAIMEPSVAAALPPGKLAKRAEKEGVVPAADVSPPTPIEPDKGEAQIPPDEGKPA